MDFTGRIVLPVKTKIQEVKSMKRVLCAFLALLMLPVLATTAFASGHGSGHGRRTHQNCAAVRQTAAAAETCEDSCRYADENGDGICDNCRNQCAGCGETGDENGDGICDSCGTCSHYADENQDGLCDHQADCATRKKAAEQTPVRRKCHSGRKHRNHH